MRDLDNLTPLDARNSLLLDRKISNQDSDTFSLAKTNLDAKDTSYQPLAHNTAAHNGYDQAQDHLVTHAAPIGVYDEGRASPAPYHDTSYGAPRGGYDARLGNGYNNNYGRGY